MVELRELKSCDIFPMIQILNKIGFSELKTILTPDKIKDMVKTFQSDDEADEEVDTKTILGFNVIFEVTGLILKNLPSCEQELYKFLSGLSGLSVKELEDLGMVEFTDMIVAVIKKPEFKDFFRAVSKLFK